MSAVWRRTGELVVQGVPFRDAVCRARVELEPGYGVLRLPELPPEGTAGRRGDHVFLAIDHHARCPRCGVEAIRHGNALEQLYDARIAEG